MPDHPRGKPATATTGAGDVQLQEPGWQQMWFGENYSQLKQPTKDLKAARAKLD